MTDAHADFLEQIRSLPDLVSTTTWPFEGRARHVLSTPETYDVRQIVLTGSGDSWMAAVAAAPAIRAWTGLPVQVSVAMEAARYLATGAGANALRGALVVSVSASGEAARVAEATERLRARGALTLAVTASPQSRVGLAAARVLDVSIPDASPAPGTRTYVAAVLALLLLGIRLAEVRLRITMDAAGGLRRELAGLGGAIAEACRLSEPRIEALVPEWRALDSADVLGSGPAFGSAAYAAAKLIEAAGVHAVMQDAEEFHHLNYFTDAPQGIATVLFAPTAAASSSRTRELASTLVELERPHLVVTDDDGVSAPERALVLPRVRELFVPLVHAVPAALLAASWSAARGVPYFRGHAGPWRGAQGARLVRNSAIETGDYTW